MMETEKRKLPRFHITPCQFHDAKLNKNFSVQDISHGGLAIRLVDRDHLPDFAVGTDHDGIVKVEGLKTEGQFKVKFIRGTLIGGEWIKPSTKLLDHLEYISQPKILGEHLKHYDLPDMGDTVWYHNPIGVDLLFYKNSSGEGPSLLRWTLYIHQSFVIWEADQGVSTGQALAEDEEGYAHGIIRLETRLIEYDQTPDRRLIESAIELITHTLLPVEQKELALSNLKSAL